MQDDGDPYLPPKGISGRPVQGVFVRFAFRWRIVPACLSVLGGGLAVLWMSVGAYAYLTVGSPDNGPLFMAFWVLTGLLFGSINFLAAWCWLKRHYFGGLIANLCSTMPLVVLVVYMEIFGP